MSDPVPDDPPPPPRPPAPGSPVQAATPDTEPASRRLSASDVVAKLLADPRLGLRLGSQLANAAPPANPPLIAEQRPAYPTGLVAPDLAQGGIAAPDLRGGGIAAPDLRRGSSALQQLEPLSTAAGGESRDRPLRSLDYVVVDVETTGGSTKHGHRITEVAAIRIAWDGTLLDEYTSLVNPERPIPPFISALTNISWEMVRDAPTFPEIARDLTRVLRGAVFVAHNASFDWRFVSWEIERATGVLPEAPRLCTVRLARKVVPEVASRSLDSLTYFFGLANHARHRAYGDARVTADLLARLLQRVDEREIVSWYALEELLGRRKPRKSRRRQGMPTAMDPSDIPAQ